MSTSTNNVTVKSLRENQIDAIINMLNLNVPVNNDNNELTQSTQPELIWKVLIYDKKGQSIISPLLKVNQLRENGITVHMSLYSDRQPIPDVPAIYFVEPTAQNIAKISEDFQKHLYDSYSINFLSSVSRLLLEDLATAAINADVHNQIKQIYDQYLNFICLEDRLFSLNLDRTYFNLNNPTTSESAIDALVNQIVDSLYSTIITMDTIPIIRCAKGTASEIIAQKIDNKLRDYLLNNRSSKFNNTITSFNRPVLIILDRNIDMTSLISHTWTYVPLIHDVLSMKLNRVTVEIEENGQKSKKVFDHDISDFFWKKNLSSPFPKVAEDVDIEINKYKKDVEDVTKQCGVSSLDEVDPNDFSSNAKYLKSAITALPELTERKRTIDMHMYIATGLLNAIKERKIDEFFSMEETIVKLNKPQLLEVINDPEKGKPEDKLRLFIMYMLSVENITQEDFVEYKNALIDAGCTVECLDYLRKIHAFTKMSNMTNNQNTGDLLGKFSSFGSKLKEGRIENLISGVKNIFPASKDLPITKIVDGLLDTGGFSSSSDHEEYLYYDPKSVKGSDPAKVPNNRMQFQDAIVFVVGGGNYNEYQNLLEYANRQNPPKTITYGTTELLTPQEFIDQLNTLGTEN